ncbi:ABC transporter permease [Leucobacter denitrificans]|uniref:ABC transporter permease n=1 Tax=Leucobacter denitrificans TaxID=683042 RepID=A0A7G9S6U8_9MICO|nr:ABC transporter permease [Leucobacter denitrificans]QNN63573.1 ABC transporter permease [Leucobacter denitrificans]
MPESQEPEDKKPGIEHFVAPFDETPVAAVDAVKVKAKKQNLWTDAWEDMRGRPMFWISAVIILLVTVVALFPTLFTSVDPRECILSRSNGAGAPGHPLGFNKQGCDIYSRMLHGTSTSVSVGLIVILMTFVIGSLFGAFAGYFGGIIDTILSRIGDIFFSIPYILAAIVVMSVLSDHRNIWVISLAIGGFAWPSTARILRAEIFRVKNSDFVMASEALGLSGQKTLWKHVIPNSIAPVIVVTTLSLSAAIVAEAVLSFLGVGLPPGQYISWGNDISAAQSDLRTRPENLIYPSIALSVTVLAFIMLGEVVRDALDPKARAQR